jgi:hypothetical protein
LIDEMGDKGRDFAEKYYDRKKIAKHLLYNIENVISND